MKELRANHLKGANIMKSKKTYKTPEQKLEKRIHKIRKIEYNLRKKYESHEISGKKYWELFKQKIKEFSLTHNIFPKISDGCYNVRYSDIRNTEVFCNVGNGDFTDSGSNTTPISDFFEEDFNNSYLLEYGDSGKKEIKDCRKEGKPFRRKKGG